jgi:hypothetical protein
MSGNGGRSLASGAMEGSIMTLRHRLGAFALVGLAVAAASAARADDTPPANLHLVGDHWTAWNPPATQPPGVRVHTVVRGDTLWALAQSYLGNPYLWPQIWEKNQYVLDAHWIYPGDPIVVGLEVAPPETVGSAVTSATSGDATASAGAGDAGSTAGAGAATGAGAGAANGAGTGSSAANGGAGSDWIGGNDPRVRAANTPIPLGYESDIYCTGFIGDLDEAFDSVIVGSEYEELTPRLNAVQNWSSAEGIFGRMDALKYELSVGDIVYLAADAGLSPGMVFTAVEPRAKVRHPASGDVVGRFYAYTGRVRVLTVLENQAIAEITQTCSGTHVGAFLRPFVEEPIPLARPPVPRPVNDPTTADLSTAPIILHSESSLFTLGQDHVVFIDRGEGDDVFPGDLFTIYRPSLKGNLPIPVGELAVLSVKEHSAVARILMSRYPIYVGDRLERR